MVGKIKWTIVVLLLYGNLAIAGAPWKSNTIINYVFDGEHNHGVWLHSIPLVDSVYTARFGSSPDMVMWVDDTTEACWLTTQLNLMPSSTPAVSADEMLSYLYLNAKSVLHGDSIVVPLKVLAYDAYGPIAASYGRVDYGWTLNIKNLRLPNDGSAWRAQVEAWAAPPPVGTQVDIDQRPLILLNMKRTTPLDTLLWGLNTGYYHDNIQAAKSILHYFPHCQILLWNIFKDACLTDDKDSVYYYGKELLSSLKNRSDSFYFDRSYYYADSVDHDPGPFPISKDDYTLIVDSVLVHGGDTTGFSHYAPSVADSMPAFDVKHWIEVNQEKKAAVARAQAGLPPK